VILLVFFEASAFRLAAALLLPAWIQHSRVQRAQYSTEEKNEFLWHCSVQYRTMLPAWIQHSREQIAQYGRLKYFSIVQYSTLQSSTVRCSEVQCSAAQEVQYSKVLIQYSTVVYSRSWAFVWLEPQEGGRHGGWQVRDGGTQRRAELGGCAHFALLATAMHWMT